MDKEGTKDMSAEMERLVMGLLMAWKVSNENCLRMTKSSVMLQQYVVIWMLVMRVA